MSHAVEQTMQDGMCPHGRSGRALFAHGIFFLLICVLLLNAAGCAALPGYQLAAKDVVVARGKEPSSAFSYQLVDLDPQTISTRRLVRPPSLEEALKERLGGMGPPVLAIGDRLQVHVWEPSADGVFSTAEQKQVTITVDVDEEGMVYIPYAGRIRAQGRRLENMRHSIELALQGKAVEPQVQLVLESSPSSKITLVGDINKPGQFPLPIKGLRLLDAVSLAGGAVSASFESRVTVMRGRRQVSAWLDQIADRVENNVFLAAGDTVMVRREPRSFSAFGAVRQNGLLTFTDERMSLMEALAQSKGLDPMAADAGGVFLFRFEHPAVALGLDAPNYGKAGSVTYGPVSDAINDAQAVEGVPVVYRLDLRRPDAYFLAQNFSMRDKDVLYVARHSAYELGQFVSLVLAPFVGTARSASAI